jgi:hypothetical protein
MIPGMLLTYTVVQLVVAPVEHRMPASNYRDQSIKWPKFLKSQCRVGDPGEAQYEF